MPWRRNSYWLKKPFPAGSFFHGGDTATIVSYTPYSSARGCGPGTMPARSGSSSFNKGSLLSLRSLRSIFLASLAILLRLFASSRSFFLKVFVDLLAMYTSRLDACETWSGRTMPPRLIAGNDLVSIPGRFRDGSCPSPILFYEDFVASRIFSQLCKVQDTAGKFLKTEDIDDEMLTWGSRTAGVLRRSKLKSNIFFSDVRYP
jgi:hypothetical protein